MERSSEISKADLLKLMTTTLEAVVDAFPAWRGDIDQLRVFAAKDILAAIGAGERDGCRLERATLMRVRAQFAIGAEQLPCVHRSSA